MLTSATARTGRVAVVLPQGALFRQGAEGRIREHVLKADLIEAVIGLAPNLFYGTGLAASVLILRQQKVDDRKGKVLFWDHGRRAVRNLCLGAAVIGVLFLLSNAPSLFPDKPLAHLLEGHLVHGLDERVLILCLFGLLLAVGVGVARAGHKTDRREGATA
jgi:hypothetical protein